MTPRHFQPRRLFQEASPAIIIDPMPDPKSVRRAALHYLTKEELIDLIVYMETNNESSLRALTFFNTKIFNRKRAALDFCAINNPASNPIDAKDTCIPMTECIGNKA